MLLKTYTKLKSRVGKVSSCSVTLLPTIHQVCHSAPYFSATSLCSVQLGASLYSSGQEAYSIASVPVDQRLRNVANVFSVAYELVDSWYRSIVGWFRMLECMCVCMIKVKCNVEPPFAPPLPSPPPPSLKPMSLSRLIVTEVVSLCEV